MDSDVQAATPAAPTRSLSTGEAPGSKDDLDEAWRAEILAQLRERVGHIGGALELTSDDREALLGVLVNEADRLDAATDQAANPWMLDAVEQHLLAVTEWKERELERVLGPTLAEQVAHFEAVEK